MSPQRKRARQTNLSSLSPADQLEDKQVKATLSRLSQVELAAVEAYERSHRDRPAVLDKLRYMRGSQPLPGYDALSPDEIADALAEADGETIRAVRDYERKFGHRRQVLDETASPSDVTCKRRRNSRPRRQGRAHPSRHPVRPPAADS